MDKIELECQEAHIKLSNGRQLRYGENPDQNAWIFQLSDQKGIAQAEILSSKKMSYNNYEDATVAYRAAQRFNQLSSNPGVIIVKHGSVCAGAIAPQLLVASQLAWDGDSKSAFGGVLALTAEVTEALINFFENKFVEVLVAPSFDKMFVEWANTAKPNLRLVQLPLDDHTPFLYQGISGGMLVQTPKSSFVKDQDALFQKAQLEDKKKIGIVTERGIDPLDKSLFKFAIAAVQYAKSNAIAIVRQPSKDSYQILGMGVGQPNRVDSLVRLALPKAIENLKKEHEQEKNYDPKGDLAKCVFASDGFYPFSDSVEYAYNAGLRYGIEPGGAIRDEEIIKKANELKMCMIFTGERFFFH